MESSSLPSERVAHNVAMQLKDTENEFDGDLGEYWSEYADSYQQIAKDYNLSMDQKLQYLHDILSKDALCFYLDALQPYATTYQQAVTMIDREYNSPVRQNRIKNYLNSLRVREFGETGLDVSSCLSKIYKLVLKLSRQVPQSHRGDAHRVQFLMKAVLS